MSFATESELPVYYLGAYGDAAELQAKSINLEVAFEDTINTKRHILIVDGSYPIDREFLKTQILAGNPVIAVGDTRLMKGLYEGQFDDGELHGTDSDGRELRETAYGYLNSLDMIRIFSTSDENLVHAAEMAYHWARQAVIEARQAAEKVTLIKDTTSPYWSSVVQRDWPSGELWNPYGQQNIRTIISKLYNDHSTTYDWYDIRFRQQLRPGCVAWGNEWENDDAWNYLDADSSQSSFFLTDYSPTTTQGTSTVGVSVGVSAGADGGSVNASISWSYSLPDVVVYDYSDFADELASWHHEIAEGTPVGQSTYMPEPGACIRVPEGFSGPYNNWKEYYKAQFTDKVCSGSWFWRECHWDQYWTAVWWE